MSPGMISAAGTSTGFPSRSALAESGKPARASAGRRFGPGLRADVEDHRHQHNGRDDDEVGTLPVNAETAAAKRRIRTSGLLNLPKKVRRQARVFDGGDLVRSGRLEDGGGVGRFHAGFGGMQPLKEIGERNDGEVRYFIPRLIRRAFW